MDTKISKILYVFKLLVNSGIYEDLDRFDNILIFQKLKELNQTINNIIK